MIPPSFIGKGHLSHIEILLIYGVVMLIALCILTAMGYAALTTWLYFRKRRR